MENSDNLIHSFQSIDKAEGNFKGLTKREYYSGLAMKALVGLYPEHIVAQKSVKYADALLTELEK